MDNKKMISTVLMALAAVALIALGVLYGVRVKKGKDAEKAVLDSLIGNVALSPEAIAQTDLEGTYSFKIEADTLSSEFTATIKRGLDDTYIITVLSEYNPEIHPFKVDGGALISERLGQGEAFYQELTGKLTLEFRQDNSVCTLVKYAE
ncbi:MAG: hypothetical protein IKX37_02500 [Bacteroidales bacterium]|nr:hypothetical protein [Bacteroidales bacterium]